ncbi:MAG: hypothetical protein QXY39_01905 [Thermofilaceae archaeon]
MAWKGEGSVKLIMGIPGVVGVYVRDGELVVYVKHGMRDAVLSKLSKLGIKHKLSLVETDGFVVVG